MSMGPLIKKGNGKSEKVLKRQVDKNSSNNYHIRVTTIPSKVQPHVFQRFQPNLHLKILALIIRLRKTEKKSFVTR